MNFQDAFLASVYATAFIGAVVIAGVKPNANGPTLTQTFQCSLSTGGHPYHTREATLVNVRDNKTGASHYELQLARLANSAHGPDSPHVRDEGTVDYPQGSGADEGIKQALAYCSHETYPAHLAPRRVL